MITSIHAKIFLESILLKMWNSTEHKFRVPSAMQQASKTHQPRASTGGFYRSHCSSCQIEWACFLYWEEYAQDFLNHSSISKCDRFPTTIFESLHKWQLFLWRSYSTVLNRFKSKPTYGCKKLSEDLVGSTRPSIHKRFLPIQSQILLITDFRDYTSPKYV